MFTAVRAPYWIAIAAAALLSAAAQAETTSEASGSRPVPKELEGLRERWIGAMDEFCVPGMAVVVIRNDEVIYLDTFGFRDMEKKLPVTPETAFYIASCTKPFTAMGVMALVDAGKVALDEPVQKYLPRFELSDADLTKKITVRDLLCHRWGISSGPIVFLDAYTGEITDDRYYRFLKTAEIEKSVSYSNVHFTLAGRVIEAASGKPWRDYLKEAVFEPAGMTSATGYADEMYARKDVAMPYEVAAMGMRPAPMRKNDSTMHAAGGLGLSIHDLGRWLRLNMGAGAIDGKRVIREESAREMLTLQSETQQGQIRIQKGFGLGWSVGSYRNKTPYVTHSGGYTGAAAHTSFAPEAKIGVAVVTNAGPPAAVLAEQVVTIDIYDRLLGLPDDDFLTKVQGMVRQRLPKLRQDAGVALTTLTRQGALSFPPDRCAGEYRNDDFGTLRIVRRDDAYAMSLGTMPVRLSRCESGTFTVLLGDDPRDGHFEVENGAVQAVVLELEAGTTRFERRD